MGKLLGTRIASRYFVFKYQEQFTAGHVFHQQDSLASLVVKGKQILVGFFNLGSLQSASNL